MIKIKTLIKLLPFLLLGIIVLNSCEGELDDLGSQLVEGNSADGYDKAFSLIAYNIDNNDVIQADASKLDSVRIGSFTESVFGEQKVAYITQLRLNTYSPDFGKNPVIDSVVLTLKPRYATDSITPNTNEDYIYPDGEVAAKKVVTTYPVSKYGRSKIGKDKAPLTIKVHEVLSFLGAASDSLSSNKAVSLNTDQVLGSKTFDGTINSVVVTKDSDASELVNLPASLRINLDKNFFQSKIIAKQGNQVLKDAASFIRYFRGISVSVEENDRYLFSMAPNDATLIMYYKNDVTATDGTGTVTRTKQQTEFSLGSSNVHLSQIQYKRANTLYESAMLKAVKVGDLHNPIPASSYADKLYMQGMGGSSIGIKIPANTIEKLQRMYKEEKIGIVSAKIRLYNDDVTWDNSYKKPSSLLVKEKDSTRFIQDMSVLSSAGYSLIKTANLSTKDAYYDISITASLKDIVENSSKFQDFVINIGSYLSNSSTGALLGQAYNDRAYNPYRLVLKGTDLNNIGEEIIKDKPNINPKSAQLRLIYTKK